jgi:hypothetical protein
VENLMRTDLRDVSTWSDQELTRPFGIFDDALPSRQAPAALGLAVRDDYDPEALRSHGEDEDEGPVDTLTWGT